MNNTSYEKRLTGIIIHGFAVAHAGAAALLSQTLVGDEVALTTLTVAMIICIARANNRSWGIGDALSVIGVLIGTYLGTRGGLLLVKWIPAIGNAANAIVTFGVTELLGWMTYILVRDNKMPNKMSKREKAELKKEAKELRTKEHAESERLYKNMSPADKEEFDQIFQQLRNKDLPEETIEYLTSRIEQIAKKYVE